ncbi:LysR family transcriptional regulator [Bordetella genomosp. 11]|uniref:LysR family transcriptional regulator n=1 Tax=Bordetella genomosp. 11 TaxID=1416808 RepID=UPI0015955694|nr:LysR family transcriptional regulator [Bordetella genomosp. 11]
MKIHQLRAFLAVFDHRSVRAAARALNLTQPAVTQATKELETSLGVQLFERGTAGVVPTIFGEALEKRARIIHFDIERAGNELDQIRDGSKGVVSIAISTAAALDVLPPAFTHFRNSYPHVEVKLNEASIPFSLPRLMSGEVEFMVSQVLPGTLPDWDVSVLYKTSMIAAVRAGHPILAAFKDADLAAAEWLLPYDNETGPTLFKQLFAESDTRPPSQIVTCTSTAMGLRLVGNSDLIGVFVKTMVGSEFPHYGLVELPLERALAPLEVCVVSRKNAVLTPAAQNFLDCLRYYANRLQG